jgi:FkbM family methyltransferase
MMECTLMLTTAAKIAIATVASRITCAGRKMVGKKSEDIFARSGFRWRLDLKEGIDFSIYLLGCFEPKTVRAYKRLIKPGDTVLDIGANVGAHVLPLAQLVSNEGQVLAFEPTLYAYQKLRANIELNPNLASRVEAYQTMLVSPNHETSHKSIYSSWPLGAQADLHPKHLGRLMSTKGATSETLDAVLERLNIAHVDFIKLDVDGHEPGVLAGAAKILERCRPTIIMELAPCLYADKRPLFDGMINQLCGLGYRFYDEARMRPIEQTAQGLWDAIRDGASCNAIVKVDRHAQGL